MSWNFILLIFIDMSGAMNRHCIPGLTMSIPDGELLCGECPGIIKTMHMGFSAYTYCIMPTPRCWHGRNRTLWFSVEKICVVFWMLSVNSNELSRWRIFMFMWIDCNPSENSCLWLFPCIAEMWFLLVQPIIGRFFYKMRVSWEFNIYNLFKSLLLTRCYRFLTRCEYYL